MTLDLEAVLSAVILVCSAITAVGAATALIVRVAVRPVIRAEVDRHLAPNGHEDLLPERERGQSLRTLVVWSRADMVDVKARLAEGDRRMDAHEDEHRDRDQTWPRWGREGV